jgi:hypothetical protein
MDIPDVSELMPRQLLELHANIEEQLRALKIMQSANNPTGDLAEYLFRTAFGWEASTNSQLGFDATDGDGKRYQIKGRRIAGFNKSRQLSALRNISEGHFDFLAGVLFWGGLRGDACGNYSARSHPTAGIISKTHQQPPVSACRRQMGSFPALKT